VSRVIHPSRGFRGTHGEVLVDDLVGQALHRVDVVQREDRACVTGADDPAATRCCTGMGSFKSRIVLLICGRDRPMRVASCSCVMPKSSSSWRYADASSSGFSCERCRFSSSASRSRSSSAVSRTIAGSTSTRLHERRACDAPHDELVFALVVETDDDRLQHAELADAVHQLREIVGIEVRARLPGLGTMSFGSI
jgi:hypothetical protein